VHTSGANLSAWKLEIVREEFEQQPCKLRSVCGWNLITFVNVWSEIPRSSASHQTVGSLVQDHRRNPHCSGKFDLPLTPVSCTTPATIGHVGWITTTVCIPERVHQLFALVQGVDRRPVRWESKVCHQTPLPPIDRRPLIVSCSLCHNSSSSQRVYEFPQHFLFQFADEQNVSCTVVCNPPSFPVIPLHQNPFASLPIDQQHRLRNLVISWVFAVSNRHRLSIHWIPVDLLRVSNQNPAQRLEFLLHWIHSSGRADEAHSVTVCPEWTTRFKRSFFAALRSLLAAAYLG